MLDGVLWGLIQGITEFLPISSDGHLVLIPPLLHLSPPDLAITGFLHLGTLLAAVTYFRRELRRIFAPEQRRLLVALVIGTIPASTAILLEDLVVEQQKSMVATSVYLILNGVVLALGARYGSGQRHLDSLRPIDAFAIGVAQVFAVLPGLSRSGTTITTGLARNFDSYDAARFSFLLGIPVVAAAGSLETYRLLDSGGIPAAAWVGAAVAAVAGYLAIGFLLRVIVKIGLLPFAIYCLAFGVVALLATSYWL